MMFNPYLTVRTLSTTSTAIVYSIGISAMQVQQLYLNISEYCYLCHYFARSLVHMNSDFAGLSAVFLVLIVHCTGLVVKRFGDSIGLVFSGNLFIYLFHSLKYSTEATQ